MLLIRVLLAAALALPGAAPTQVFIVPPTIQSAPVTGTEDGLGLRLPDATPDEVSAGLVWTMRAGFNVAALQCAHSDFLDTTGSYNALLTDKRTDLAKAYKELNGYFQRMAGPKATKAGTKAFDDYNTKTYNGWSTLYAQRIFCNTAAKLGKDLRFAPIGGVTAFAQANMREFRNSLVYAGDPLLASRALYMPPPELRLTDDCYDRKGNVKAKCLR